jgi:hypothetical protein
LTSSNPQDHDVVARPQTTGEGPATLSGGPGRSGDDRSRLRWGIAAVLALVAVVAAVLVVLEVTSLRPKYHAAQTDQQARSAVTRAAERFTVQVNTYDAASMGSYQKSMNSMMSPKFQADYKKVIAQLSSTIKQAKVRSKGQVLASGVSSVDADSAQVLVVSDASVKTVFDPNVARHFRWEVSLVKINGKWLVDDFSPVS